MSVNTGAALKAAILNEAFLSRTSNTSLVGVVALNNSSSGGLIANAQQQINNNKDNLALSVRTKYSTQIIGAGGAIDLVSTIQQQVRPVAGNAAPVALSLTPFGTDDSVFLDGMEIEIYGTDNTNTVEISRNDAQFGCLLNGDIVLYKGTYLTLVYDSTLERFLEKSRNE